MKLDASIIYIFLFFCFFVSPLNPTQCEESLLVLFTCWLGAFSMLRTCSPAFKNCKKLTIRMCFLWSLYVHLLTGCAGDTSTRSIKSKFLHLTNDKRCCPIVSPVHQRGNFYYTYKYFMLHVPDAQTSFIPPSWWYSRWLLKLERKSKTQPCFSKDTAKPLHSPGQSKTCRTPTDIRPHTGPCD